MGGPGVLQHPGARYSHVGTYLGSGHFVRTPFTESRVRIVNLSPPYWMSHYGGARRLLLSFIPD
ncbi:NlpC/P60 family protein [Ralstonia insidiosa]|uniref:NlpC/P60 family protein n=1 Tax=Ralstonia insidiosa TaxID=190721 RepID=UPI003CC91820